MNDLTPTAAALRDSMYQAFDCQQLPARSLKRMDKREVRAREKRQKQCEQVIAAYTQAWRESRPLETQEQAVSSVAAILLPFLLRWLLPAIMEQMIAWLWKKNQD